MAAFGIHVRKRLKVENFIVETNKKLNESDFVRNPFKGELFSLGDCVAVYMNPVYVNFPLYAGILAVVLALVFGARFWGFLPAAFFFLLSLMWTRFFYYILLRIGLRKAGYIGKIKIMKTEELIRRLMENGSERCAQVPSGHEGNEPEILDSKRGPKRAEG